MINDLSIIIVVTKDKGATIGRTGIYVDTEAENMPKAFKTNSALTLQVDKFECTTAKDNSKAVTLFGNFDKHPIKAKFIYTVPQQDYLKLKATTRFKFDKNIDLATVNYVMNSYDPFILVDAKE